MYNQAVLVSFNILSTPPSSYDNVMLAILLFELKSPKLYHLLTSEALELLPIPHV